MQVASEIGAYLRARREAVRPEAVGLTAGTRRRLPGLRREEVALLAGISAEYYTRLEQGRERRPSVEVLAGLGRALALDQASEDFLRVLAGHAPRNATRPRTATGDLQGFLDSLAATPAFAHDRVLEVVAANRSARRLAPVFVPGVNLVRAAFTDPGLAVLYVNHEEMSARLVTYLRAQASVPPADPRLGPLVDELGAVSPRFAALWRRHEVAPASTGLNRLRHPDLGPLELRFERLCFAGSDDPVLVVYHAAPGSPTAAVLARLAAQPDQSVEPDQPVEPDQAVEPGQPGEVAVEAPV